MGIGTLPPGSSSRRFGGRCTLPDFDDTRAVEWFAALDYGFAHYTVACWGAGWRRETRSSWMNTRNGFGCRNATRRPSRRCWPGTRSATGNWPLSGPETVRGGRGCVFSRQSTGRRLRAICETAGNHGCAVRTLDRVNGWAEILQGFGDVEAGVKPTLVHSQAVRAAAGNVAGVAT
jgi:hypothetical protein